MLAMLNARKRLRKVLDPMQCSKRLSMIRMSIEVAADGRPTHVV